MTFIAVVFLVVLGIVCGAYWMFVLLPEDDARRRLHRRLKGGSDKTRARRHSVLKKETKDTVKLEVLEAVLNRAGGKLQPLRRLVDQSGVRVTISALVLTSGCLLLFTLLLVFSLTARPLAGLVAGVVAASLPFMYLHRVRTKRLRKFEEGFPDAIDLIARSLRAGHAFSTGLSMVAEEVDAPVGTEFKTIYEQQNYGIPMSDALKGLAQRVSLVDVRFFVTAVLMSGLAQRVSLVDVRFFVTAVLTQREAGGNLAEVLNNLATVIRERFKVKRQVRVLSAHGRMSGWILAGLPPALAFAFMLVVPTHLESLFNDPLGVRMVVVALVLQVLGMLVIRRIVNIEY